MKKLSIVLALIMALSCFCFTAFAAVGDACDYTTLDKAIEEAKKEKDTTKYTDDSVKAFEEALEAAEEVDRNLTVDDKGENQKKINDAAKALKDATKGLKVKPEEVTVRVNIIAKDSKGDTIDDANSIFPYYFDIPGYTVGSTITADKILAAAKARVLYKETGDKVIDTEKFVVSPVVVLEDGLEGSEIESAKFTGAGTYNFYVYIFEIDPVENLAQVAATEVGGHVDWKGIASANVNLINQVIKGAQAAADTLAKADYPEIGEKNTENAKKADGAVKGDKVVRTPDTGASAVAGVAVVVLALSATTAVVLRKKED